MLSVLYNIIIMPIQIIVEMTYSLMSRMLGNKGYAIIAVSIVIQTLILPLYMRADAIQEEEIKKQKSMSDGIEHIKKTFSGDERYMMLQSFYRHNKYKTWYPLKSAISILLQVPFFIAAYNYLSHLEELEGVAFLFINDLSKADALFSVGSFQINILPVVMTVFNLISCVIYSKGLPIKTQVQGWTLALVFLVLLYTSPSGLVLYWTCNNLYSLMKNIVMKLIPKKEKKESKLRQRFFDYVGIVSVDTKAVVIEELFMTMLMGALIPFTVIGSSATEFILGNTNPIDVVLNNFEVYVGFFVFWISIFYFLMSENAKKVFKILFFALSVSAFVNYMIFGSKQGEMNSLLKYDFGLYTSLSLKIINLLVLAAVVFICFVMMKKYPKVCSSIMVIAIVCGSILCIMSGISESKSMKQYYANQKMKATSDIVTLSKKGNNVVFLMVDRAMGYLLPYIFEEKPELAQSYEGFTYYPNTLSFGKSTNFGAPALYGGYEYTPEEMNKRSDEKMVDKHNESLKVLPKLFSEEGYNVTVCDSPLAGYKWDTDMSIYDDIEGVNTYITQGAYNDVVTGENNFAIQKRNFIYYSLFKIVPSFMRGKIYNDGQYCTTIKQKDYFGSTFFDWYFALDSLDDMVNISKDDSNNCFIIQNSTSHAAILLETPSYELTESVDIEAELAKKPDLTVDGKHLNMPNEYELSHFQINLVTIKLIAKWLDYLKENGVYDNTRIVIVSDHGRDMNMVDDYVFDNGVDIEAFNPLLLYKDFNSKGKITTDSTFMTNADAPTMAVNGIILNPINPYTGKKLDSSEKYNHDQLVTGSNNWDIEGFDGNITDTSDAPWYSVHDDIFKESNWKIIKE